MGFRVLVSMIVADVLGSMTAVALAQPKVGLGKREDDGQCAVCHGLDGKGKGPYAEPLKQPLPDLTTMALLEYPKPLQAK